MIVVPFRKSWLLLLLLLLTACSSSQVAEKDEAPTGRRLEDWTTLPEPDAIRQYGARVRPFVGKPAALEALVADRPAMSHALFLLADDDPALAMSMARALNTRSELYVRSMTRRREAPERHAAARRKLERSWSLLLGDPERARLSARQAGTSFTDLADPLYRTEADLAAVSAELQLGETAGEDLTIPGEAPLPQRARANYLRLGLLGSTPERFWGAADEAREAKDPFLMKRLEDLRERLSIPSPPGRMQTWLQALAREHLQLGRPLIALQHAATAIRAEPGPADEARGRLLLARAHRRVGKLEAALNEAHAALDAADQTGQPALGAEAHAVAGRILLDMKRPGLARDSFRKAGEAHLQTGNENGHARQLLNRATCAMQEGTLDSARELLNGIPTGSSADIRARRDILKHLIELLDGTESAGQIATHVEHILTRAERAGAYRVLETYRGLPGRLKQRK